VSDVLPTGACLWSPAEIDEGGAATLAVNATGFDAEGNGITYTFNGNAFTAVTPPTTTFTTPGTVVATAAVKDDDGNTGSNTCTLTVNDLKPTFTSATLNPSPVYATATTNLTVVISNPGGFTNDPLTVTVNFGDGTSSITITQAGPGITWDVSGTTLTITLTHVYSTSGPYTVTITSDDDDSVVAGAPDAITTAPITVNAKPVPVVTVTWKYPYAYVGEVGGSNGRRRCTCCCWACAWPHLLDALLMHPPSPRMLLPVCCVVF
jgi:hypothetical protein